MKFYKVTVLRGHLGTKYMHGTITFYEKARNALQAMDKARSHPGVKHDRMPLACVEVSEAEFFVGMKQSAYVRAGCRTE